MLKKIEFKTTAVLPARILKEMEKYTPFMRAVWQACAEIPEGETRTYGWIAKRIGRPNAARAVGMALGKNPFAPIVPCHRVVGANGIGGFSAPGGIAAKQALLLKERLKKAA